jgi:uncharacterized protein
MALPHMNAATPIGALGVDARARFIARTYAHLFGAILGFVGIEVALFASGIAEVMAKAMLGVNWLFVLGGFVVVSWLATRVAHGSNSLPSQYGALALFVVAEAIIFVPLLYVAEAYAPGTIEAAGAVTLAGFAALTAVAFFTRKDFSFLRPFILWGGIVAMLLIVAGALFGFDLGMAFAVGMVALAGGSILYDTSKILRSYPEHRYVGAALQLFASVALLFWYVLQIFLRMRK